MSFLKNLFGKSEPNKPEPGITNKPVTVTFPPVQTMDELFAQYGALGFEKQADVPSVISNHPWSFNMDTGTISFGSTLRFPVQIVGTLSHSSQTWLWAWANEKSGIPAQLTHQANQLRKYGETNGLDLLQIRTFDAGLNDVHKIGCIASGMFNASCYYIADYGEGAMLVTIKAKEFDAVQKNDRLRIITTFSQVISSFDVNHREAFRNYLTAKGYEVTEEANKVRGQHGNDIINGEFDGQDRLTNMTS